MVATCSKRVIRWCVFTCLQEFWFNFSIHRLWHYSIALTHVHHLLSSSITKVKMKLQEKSWWRLLKTSMAKTDLKSDGRRTFLPLWKKEFSWLIYSDKLGTTKCSICSKQKPSAAAELFEVITGSKNFKEEIQIAQTDPVKVKSLSSLGVKHLSSGLG